MHQFTIITCTVGQMATNCYIVFDPRTHEGIVIDPGDDAEYICDTLLTEKIHPTMVLATHGHFDHLMGALAVSTGFGIPFALHKHDEFLVARMTASARHFLGVQADPAPRVNRYLREGEILRVGRYELTVMETPGHTPGSICLYNTNGDTLFCGDLLFSGGGVGRTDHQYASRTMLEASISRIFLLPKKTTLYCGHGDRTTIGKELRFHVQ